MEYLIKCPKCEMADLELNNAKNKKSGKTFHCTDCGLDFLVESRDIKKIVEQQWKKRFLAAVILI